MPRKSLLSLYDRFYTFAEEVTAARRLPREILHLIRAHVGLTEEHFLDKIDSLEDKFLRGERNVPYHQLREAYNERMFIWGLIEKTRSTTDDGWGPAQILYKECLYNEQKAKALVAYKLYDDARGKHREEQQRLKDEIRKVEMEYLEFTEKKKVVPGVVVAVRAAAVASVKKPTPSPQQPPKKMLRPPADRYFHFYFYSWGEGGGWGG